ncbi:hypothetical protein AVM02_10615 [Brucella anthropi]
MTMPETPMNKHRNLILGQHKVGPSGESCASQPVTKTEFMECFSQGDLRFGIFRADSRHPLRALDWSQKIDQCASLNKPVYFSLDR